MSTAVISRAASYTAVMHTAAVNAAPRGSAQPHLRLTARGRAVLTVLFAAPIVALVLFFSLNGGGATATDTTGAPLQTVTVLAGQSLWALAGEVAPQADPREFIADVLAVNGLSDAGVRPGQVLEIPAQYAH